MDVPLTCLKLGDTCRNNHSYPKPLLSLHILFTEIHFLLIKVNINSVSLKKVNIIKINFNAINKPISYNFLYTSKL